MLMGMQIRTEMGPRTRARLVAYAVRVQRLPLLKDVYGPSGNPMVAAARAGTATSASDKAKRANKGPGGRGPTQPNRRLAAFGMRVEIDERERDGYRLVGGTARQKRCYRRAVDQWLLDDPIE